MPSTSNRQASIDSRRIALEREITIRVPRFDTFVTEYSTNISTTGMFIVSEKPHAPGTTFTFEFSVADDWKLIRGKAQVVWTRYRHEDKGRPAGMGVRFVELDAQSRRLIRWIVEKHIREGGKPFELDELRNVIDEALEDVIDADDRSTSEAPVKRSAPVRARPAARRPPMGTARSKQRKLFPLVATAAAIVLGIAFLFWLTEWLPERDAASAATAASRTEATDGLLAESEAGDGETASGGVDDAGNTANSPTGGETSGREVSAQASTTAGDSSPSGERRSIGAPPLGSAYNGVRDALAAWSSAWSAQDVNGYLAAYSREFKPQGTSRAAWEAQRRERLTAPSFIKVSISRLEITRVRDNLVEANFFQSYRSDRFSDSVQKTFELIWEDGSWKILSERTR